MCCEPSDKRQDTCMPHAVCGCSGARRFLTPAERIEMLEEYKKQLQKEIAGVESAIKEIKE